MTEMQEMLRKLRKKRGLTQEQFADIIHITQEAYSNYERGTRTPDIITLIKIADYYEISLDLLTGRYKRSE